MNTRPTPSEPDSDARLKQGLRDAFVRSPDEGLAALEARAMAQWQQRSSAAQPVVHAGPLATVQAGWRELPRVWRGALMVVVLATLLWLRPWAPAEPGIDELMQPDVLSLITMGEL
ncbi:MAG: hypothetical protein IV088_11310 [Hydrogenophaga sp.]|uniref:hypothetical protein n=1 Tax=Hydrogenophaga sp. TaxID=1904254 RepID=UPI0025C5CB2F|nr:hypothetical protein [Hydrogenophaga sp.]MBT9551430.1 hypothetical protein [Hydrogenophaga sp.]